MTRVQVLKEWCRENTISFPVKKVTKSSVKSVSRQAVTRGVVQTAPVVSDIAPDVVIEQVDDEMDIDNYGYVLEDISDIDIEQVFATTDVIDEDVQVIGVVGSVAKLPDIDNFMIKSETMENDLDTHMAEHEVFFIKEKVKFSDAYLNRILAQSQTLASYSSQTKNSIILALIMKDIELY